MFTIEESKKSKGFKSVKENIAVIENTRKERFDQNLALAGYNGKNIVLTGNFSERKFKPVGSNTERSYIVLEAVYFDDKPETGKVGTLALSALKASVKPSINENLQSVVADFTELSERDALNKLLEEKTYLKCEGELTVLRPEFYQENGQNKVRYDETKTKKGYKYSVQTL